MYSNCSITSFLQTPVIYFQKFKVFNEMEMEINVINNGIFTKL